ncbi:hypothetical protein MHH60_32245 [Paenibacillus sp. FSL H7-0716]|nr:hypothetical protein [Paenibacillus odorifer]
MMVIEAPRTRPQNDQMEVTFRYSYLLHAPKLIIQNNGQQVQKINGFFIDQGLMFDSVVMLTGNGSLIKELLKTGIMSNVTIMSF